MFGFVGSERFVIGLHDALVAKVGLTAKAIQFLKHRHLESKIGKVNWYSWADIRKFYDFIYPEGFGFCLERKRRVLAEWLEANPVQPKIGNPDW